MWSIFEMIAAYLDYLVSSLWFALILIAMVVHNLIQHIDMFPIYLICGTLVGLFIVMTLILTYNDGNKR